MSYIILQMFRSIVNNMFTWRRSQLETKLIF